MQGEAVDAADVLAGEVVGRPELDLRLHVGQVDPGGERARAVVPLLGLLDEGVWTDTHRHTQTRNINMFRQQYNTT